MNFNFLTYFKDQLIRLKRGIESKIKKLYKVPEFGSDVDSGEEESDESEEFGNQLSVAQEYKERLANIDTALKKIERKKYGVCERCGKKISLDVLKIAPESRLCKECKKKAR
jgi:DnaK suppressor protein